MNSAMKAVSTITTIVDPKTSSRVDQDTFPSSVFTSPKKATIFFTFTSLVPAGAPHPAFLQGRRDLNPQDGIWSLAV